ncbi:hypothetical protein J2X46_003148 [Nocardioides sp. BE266]|uniref:hypothetical protein n=1 Tax=Nocardioides sp. BE266 TaxID=2817725 RepID=UPI002865B0F2|nr:hypothetical protein [Nocardioides sp. BE266]MDR7254155.1 hypothetical protein [Nocardioides sp. BE266]
MNPHPLSHEDELRAIGEISALLDRAYDQTWAIELPDPPRMDLGLGIYLVRAQPYLALSTAAPVLGPERDDHSGVPALLRAAERLTRTLPLRTAALPDAAELAVDLCDLIRDADRIPW